MSWKKIHQEIPENQECSKRRVCCPQDKQNWNSERNAKSCTQIIFRERKMCVTPHLNLKLNKLTLRMMMQQGLLPGISFQFKGGIVRQSLQFLLKVLGGRADSYGCFTHQTGITAILLRLFGHHRTYRLYGQASHSWLLCLTDRLQLAQFWIPPDPTQSSHSNKLNCKSKYCPWTCMFHSQTSTKLNCMEIDCLWENYF